MVDLPWEHIEFQERVFLCGSTTLNSISARKEDYLTGASHFSRASSQLPKTSARVDKAFS